MNSDHLNRAPRTPFARIAKTKAPDLLRVTGRPSKKPPQDWHELCQAALFELDPAKLFERIALARRVVLDRIESHSVSDSEQQSRLPAPILQRSKFSCYNPCQGELMNLNGMKSLVAELRAQRVNFVNQITHVDAALAVLGKLNGNASVKSRTISAAGRKRIAAAQVARWAKSRGTATVTRRTMSAASRRKIAAAQRARWAKLKRG